MKLLLVGIGSAYPHVNLAVHALSAYVRDPRWTTRVLELTLQQPLDASLRAIARQEADIVGFSCSLWNVERVERIARALRIARPKTLIVLGGPEVTARPSEWLRRCAADVCICGEGEALLFDLMEVVFHARAAGRFGRGVIDGPLILSAESGSEPLRWADPYPEGIAGFGNRIVYLETARGCPFSCAYCMSGGDPVRAMPAGEALSALLKVSGAGIVKLVDRTFNFDEARAREIWRGLIQKGLGTRWHFEICAELLQEESLRLLETAPEGLFQFEIGVQSANDAVCASVGRRADFERLAGNVRRLRAAGNIPLHLDLIAGLPGEDWESFRESFNRVHALRPDRLQLGFLKVLPGSALRGPAYLGILKYAPDPPYEVIESDAMTFEELSHLHDVEEALERYGNSGRFRTLCRCLFEVLGREPFAFYEGLAAFLRAEGCLDDGRSPQAAFGDIWRYLAAGNDGELLKRALCFDWCLAFDQSPPEAFAASQPRRRTPGMPRAVRLEAFDVDVLAMLEQGVLRQEGVVLRIDCRRHTAAREPAQG